MESAQEHDATRTPTNANTEENSFLHGAPISSTPFRDPSKVALPRNSEDDDSWAASIESPFERLGRQVRDLTLEETRQQDYPSTSSAPSFSPLHGSYTGAVPSRHTAQQSHPRAEEAPPEPTPQIPRSRHKGKSPLRQNVLRQNAALAAASEGTSTPAPSLHTPRRNKTPRNPFFPPNSSARHWNGLVDLRQPSPARSRAPRAAELSSSGGDTSNGFDSDSSDDLFPPGMSPPVTMQFAMASRARATPAKLAPTPAKKAAERIGNDLVATARIRDTVKRLKSPLKAGSGEPSISSVAPSLPSLTRYSGRPKYSSELPITSVQDLSLPQGKFVTPAHQIYRSRMGPQAAAQVTQPIQSGNKQERSYAAPDPRLVVVDEAIPPSPGSDSDSDASVHDESNPSAGFLFATQNNARAQTDDSFSSSQQSMSSDEDDDEAARAARHPLAHIFAGGSQGVEDSFDQEESFTQAPGLGEEDTVFGARQVGQAGERRLTLMRDALIDDTHTGAVSLNPFAQVDQSPTPYVGRTEELG
ncbi:hypothetical protein K439DRAFT_1126989 [Ramaria rubella]|nr:hypothetical protein K439DRAFT_1126989 [Ramaria rubella]